MSAHAARRPSAEWTARTVARIATAAVGTALLVGAVHLTYRVEVPVAGEWLISLMEIRWPAGPIVVRTVRVRRGGPREFEVVRTVTGGPLDGLECVLGETWSVEAALGIALEYVTTP